ncbi:MAG: hypothetical protein FJ279_12255 [Planctomycetes bacterium]|nr:hypothetical protein [Planctomycetota bacterium]MBM4078563.1 hypothetical protein [Planctomycetota bacterium]
MAKCVKCNERKGKRLCQPLGASICSQCCGQYRMGEIDCNADCPFLKTGEGWDRERRMKRAASKGREYIAERFRAFPSPHGDQPDLPKFFFCFKIESLIHLFHREHKGLLDSDVIAALQGVRMTFSPVTILSSARTPLEDAIVKRLELTSDEDRGQLARSDRLSCIEELLSSVKSHAGGKPDSTKYLAFIAAYFQEAPESVLGSVKEAETKRSGLIVLP